MKMILILLDVMGGDYGVEVVILGVEIFFVCYFEICYLFYGNEVVVCFLLD